MTTEAWELLAADMLDGIAAGTRRELWSLLKLRRAMPAGSVVTRLSDYAREEERRGDRLRLHLPADAARRLQRKQENANMLTAMAGAVRSGRSRFWLDVYAGAYLDHDPADPFGRAWPTAHRRRRVQRSALVALAAHDVTALVGCTPEESVMFLLADERPTPSRARMSASVPGGLRLWVFDPFITGEELAREYVSLRRLWLPQNRPKRPERRVDEVLAIVAEMRPHVGRHVDNALWSEVLERVNAKWPKTMYADTKSLQRAVRQAHARREEMGYR